MLQAKLEVKGLNEILAKLEKIDPTLKNLEPEMKEAGEYLIQFFMEVIASQGGSIGEFYAPLSEAYAAQKAKQYPGTPILVASGKMVNSYKLYTASDYLDIKNEAQNSRGDYYAGYHQDGTAKMPQRMMVKLQVEQLAYISGLIMGRLHAIMNFR